MERDKRDDDEDRGGAERQPFFSHLSCWMMVLLLLSQCTHARGEQKQKILDFRKLVCLSLSYKRCSAEFDVRSMSDR